MKNVSGGVAAGDQVVGTRGSSSYGFCYCDIQPANGGPTQCEVPCPTSVCDWFNAMTSYPA